MAFNVKAQAAWSKECRRSARGQGRAGGDCVHCRGCVVLCGCWCNRDVAFAAGEHSAGPDTAHARVWVAGSPCRRTPRSVTCGPSAARPLGARIWPSATKTMSMTLFAWIPTRNCKRPCACKASNRTRGALSTWSALRISSPTPPWSSLQRPPTAAMPPWPARKSSSRSPLRASSSAWNRHSKVAHALPSLAWQPRSLTRRVAVVKICCLLSCSAPPTAS